MIVTSFIVFEVIYNDQLVNPHMSKVNEGNVETMKMNVSDPIMIFCNAW